MELKDYALKMLDISTRHIPKFTAEALEYGAKHRNGLWFDIAYEPWGHYGWILLATEYQAEDALAAGHIELSNLLAFATQNDYGFLKLDCDALQLPEKAGFALYA